MPSGYKLIDLWDSIVNMAYDASESANDAYFEIFGHDFPLTKITESVDSAVAPGAVCTVSADGNHHATTRGDVLSVADGGMFKCTCSYCGQEYLVKASDNAKREYQNMVDVLPSNNISSDGSFEWRPKIVSAIGHTAGSGSYQAGIVSTSFSDYAATILIRAKSSASLQGFDSKRAMIRMSDVIPVTGFYYRQNSSMSSGSVVWYSNMSTYSVAHNYSLDSTGLYYTAGTVFDKYSYIHFSSVSDAPKFTYGAVTSSDSASTSTYFNRVDVYLHSPVYKVFPDFALSNSAYNVNNYVSNYAPTINVGGVTNNNKIVNTTNNTFYNPTTNNYYTVNNYNYDLRSFSYNMTVEDEDEVEHQVVVTYGDQSVTVNFDGSSSTYIYITLDIGGGGEGGETVEVDLTETNNLLTDIKNFCEDIWETCTNVDAGIENIYNLISDWDFTGSGGSPTDPENPDFPDYSTPLGRIIELLNTISEKLGNDNDEIIYVGSDGVDEELDLDSFGADVIGKFDWIWSFRNVMHTFVEDAVGTNVDLDEVNIQVPNENTAVDGDADSDAPHSSVDSAFYNPASAPEVYINFANAESKYNYGGSVRILDLSWYAEYKEDVDRLLGGILWAFFLWKLFKSIPSILGMSPLEQEARVRVEFPEWWTASPSRMNWGGLD